ncbi:hypothetical protein PAPHI01_0236 [Pancytospora philotis]|nr:hypothetical protein PAPHI01_0236 [Pancytospora philotis]
MASTSPQYYPALFSKSETEEAKQETEHVIPQTTLYDQPLEAHHTPCERHITIFGFSPQNKLSVLAEIKRLASVRKKEEGRNYVSVWAKDPSDLERLMKLNHQVIGGEIIGVFRRNFGAVQSADIYMKKKSVLTVIKEYFFGE